MNDVSEQGRARGMPRLLFLGGGAFYPHAIPNLEKFTSLGEYFTGEILAPVLEPADIRAIAGFRLNTYAYLQRSSILRNVYSFLSIVLRGVFISLRRGRFDVIVSPNPLMTAIAGLLLARLTGAKLLVEVNGNFESAFKFGREGQQETGRIDHLKDWLSGKLIPFVLHRADVVKLVYSRQLDSLAVNQDRVRIAAFPNFVPIRRFIEAPKHDGRYILLMGFPWYLKGVDILIQAFNRVAADYPDMSLKIVGWCPEGREYFEQLAAGNERIHLMEPVEYDAVIELMAGCSLYVLASRTDSSPRVLREAMASAKPIIASDTDGVPDLIRDGDNGLLFRNGSIDDLETRLRIVLSDPELAGRLAQAGFVYVQESLSEKVYLEKYRDLVRLACS